MVAPDGTMGRVDRYELLDLVGQGSFGGVYRARHIHTGQVVALKLARVAVDPDAAARILAEGRAAASLRHPNVVGIQDSGISEKGEAFVVMELLEGKNLAAVLATEGPLAPSRAASIALQMLDGLAAAHAAGVVHRDVKPSNVFIGAADAVKVIDFGISKLRESGHGTGHVVLTIPGVAMGTPGYMAPEQLGDASSVDARADVYSVGATLYEMLSKKRPIDADGFEEWMRRLATDTALPLAAIAPTVPPAIAAVVDRAVARDRDARWPSAQSMRDALANALGPPTVARMEAPSRVSAISAAPPAAASAPKPSAVPWIFAGIGVALALMSVGGLAVLVVRGTPGIAPSATPSAKTSNAKPDDVDDDDDSPPSAVPSPTAPARPTATAKASAVPGRPVKLSFYPPRTVGEIKADAFFPLAERARPRIELCNPDRRAETVFVDLMVNEHRVSQAFPSANEAGDKRLAKCVAQALLDASWPGFSPGGSGIYQSAEIIWK